MKFKRENKGFSLVELIVVIAIFSVVGVVVGGFLFAASRSYSINANELNLQDESQLVANQVQEMILDTAYGISYKYIVTDETGSQLIDFMNNDATVALPAGDLSQKQLYIYGDGTFTHLSWDTENKQLYLMEYEYIPEGEDIGDGTKVFYKPVDSMVGLEPKGVLLGEYIEDFKVDLTKVASNRMVSFNILFKMPGTDREYMVARSVSLRNDVLTNKEMTEVYSSVGIEISPLPDKMEVTPTADVYVWPGEAQQYIAKLICEKKGGVPNQNVTWTVASGDGVALHPDTKMSAADLLTVSQDEQSSKLVVTAKASGYDYDSDAPLVLSESRNINVRQIRNLTISQNDFENPAFPITKGGTYKVKVNMSGDNLPSTITDAGSIIPQFTAGKDYALVTSMVVTGLTAEFTINILNTAPEDGEIGLVFKPGKAEFDDVQVATPVYKFDGAANGALKMYSDSGLEWLRNGVAKTRVEFSDSSFEDTICNDDGTLGDGYSIRYTYRVYDKDYALCRTLSSTVGSSESKTVDSSYISDIINSSEYNSEAVLSDKLFLQSGTVVVSAELLHTTAGSAVTVATSDNLTYFIPEAQISFKRASADVGVSNMKSYITKKMNVAPIYISFTGGFAGTDYKVALNKASCINTEYGNIDSSASDVSKNCIAVVGNKDAEYKFSENNVIEFNYGGLSNKVSVVLTTPNVIGTDYYVPLNIDEWTNIGYIENGNNKTVKYEYYIDNNHYMYVEYLNNNFSKATFNYKQNMAWKKTAYTMNKVNKTWELATP